MHRELLAPLVLTGKLWWRFWPQLTLLVLIGIVINDWLIWLSVQIGLVDHMMGLVALTLVVLAKLIVIVVMFHTMRPALPALAAVHASVAGTSPLAAGGPEPQEARPLTVLSAILMVALVPFFAYYTAWGFLDNTLREYRLLWSNYLDLFERNDPFDVLDSRWLLLSVGLTWVLRRAFKMMKDRSGAPIWRLLIIVCETNWAFIGLYVLSQWKDEAWAWIQNSAIWPYLQRIWDAVTTPIAAALAAPVPADKLPPDGLTQATDLFYFALLPLVWLLMAAVIYGYDMAADAGWARHRRLERISNRYGALPRVVRDFIDHFVSGYRSRYLPVANSVRLTLGSGFVLLLVYIVAWQAISWGALWLWIGASHLIGPHALPVWQVIAHQLSLLLGSPIRFTTPGILPETLRFCLIAAVLETAFAMMQSRAPAPTEAEPVAEG